MHFLSSFIYGRSEFRQTYHITEVFGAKIKCSSPKYLYFKGFLSQKSPFLLSPLLLKYFCRTLVCGPLKEEGVAIIWQREKNI